jgi:DNA-binding CsgD family transcriptional regulator
MYALRRTLLDPRRGVAPGAMLDCAAHMLLYFDEPRTMRRIALQHLVEHFGATRAGFSFGSPNGAKLESCDEVKRADSDVADRIGTAWSCQHPALQLIWRSKHTIYVDVRQLPVLDSARLMLECYNIRAKMVRRLEVADHRFGTVCIEQMDEYRQWSVADLAYLDQFVLDFLSPIIAQALAGTAESRDALTAAELAVVRLAAVGLSYKEIAGELGKSPHTVDNQLRQIRKRLGVRNQVELVRACTNLL